MCIFTSIRAFPQLVATLRELSYAGYLWTPFVLEMVGGSMCSVAASLTLAHSARNALQLRPGRKDWDGPALLWRTVPSDGRATLLLKMLRALLHSSPAALLDLAKCCRQCCSPNAAHQMLCAMQLFACRCIDALPSARSPC
jgi:hypothetical protein